MATGVLRPPKHVATLDDYRRTADHINTKMSNDLVFANWNEGGVCVIVKKGDPYRCASLIAELEGVLTTLEYHSDPKNKMIYIK